MSKRELWEIVRADELQPDDVIRLDIYSHAIHVDRLIFGGGLVQIYPSKDSDRKSTRLNSSHRL